ncbi:MAG TPA: DUF6600 domain-containing protein [Prolixibacteraceae bacterium]|nr:DUF6600 domain-containing protein [Prolixibacteraceae bacterium]
MKTIRIAYLLLIILLVQSCAVRQQEARYTQEETVDFQLFYDQLSPYGQWIEYTNYGYVWVPDVRREFTPYSTNGHWVMSDYGWTWASDYRWGWAPFHYGRWDYDNYFGWFWGPDDQWGPAWVTWRGGNGYYGWAPMRPGVSISTSFNERRRDINRWNFVRDRNLGERDLQRYYINRGNYNSILDNTSVINHTRNDSRRNATYVAGPPEESVQRATGRTVNRVRIQDNGRPGERLANDELRIYRPRVRRSSDSNTAPAKVASREEIKPVRERGTANQRNINPFDNRREEQRNQEGRQTERRRTDRSPDQQQIEKSRQIPQTQQADPQQQPNERRSMERPRQRQTDRQNRNEQISEVTPPSSQKEGSIEQQQVEKQDRTRQEQLEKQQQQQVQRQQQQLERKQQQLEKQQELQQRRQERQQIRQQQTEKSQQIPQGQTSQRQEQNQQEPNTTAPSGSRRR